MKFFQIRAALITAAPILLSLTLLGKPSASQLPPRLNTMVERPSIDLQDEWFFTYFKDHEGVMKMVRIEKALPTLTFKQPFGCMFKFQTSAPLLHFRIQLKTPEPMSHLRMKDVRISHSSDGKVAILEKTVSTSSGEAGYWISMDPEDPKGRYEMTCTLGGVSNKPFEFYIE